MNGKVIKFFLILVICVTSLFFNFRYLQLWNNYKAMKTQEKSILSTYLNSSITYADRIDLRKASDGDKESLLSLIAMYEGISNSNIALWTTFKGEIEIIDPMYTSLYTGVLKDIIDKSVKGDIKDQDINNFKLIKENIELIYKYVSGNNKLSSNAFKKEVLPNLKSISLP